jgi:signal transduction histidine kinase
MLRRLPARLRHPQTTVRWRLTLIYGGLFLVSGAALLAITYALVTHATLTGGPRAEFAVAPPGAKLQVHVGAANRKVRIPPGALPPDFSRALRSPAGRIVVNFVGATQRVADLNQLEEESGIALAIMAVISGLLGWLVAGRVLRPLRTITATAHEISEASLHRRLAMPGPRDELRQLADTIDGLLERLEGAFDAQRRFVANASHELRTPLTAARALLEMVIADPRASVKDFRHVCGEVLKENEYQEQLIDSLLALAQAQRGLAQREVFSLEALVRDQLRSTEGDASALGLHVEASLEPAFVSGDRRLVLRLVSNLLENAIRHNVQEGQVRVAVGTREGDSLLEIANTGPVVPAGEIDRLLQPFQRLGPDRTGHGEGLGLGLSIVTAIADAHDAALLVHPRPEGGLAVELRFPRAVGEGDREPESETALPTPAVDMVTS